MASWPQATSDCSFLSPPTNIRGVVRGADTLQQPLQDLVLPVEGCIVQQRLSSTVTHNHGYPRLLHQPLDTLQVAMLGEGQGGG